MKRTFKFLVVGAVAVALAGCASRRLASQGGRPQYVPPAPPQPVPVFPPPGSVVYPPGSVPAGNVPPGFAAPGNLGGQPSSPAIPGPGGQPAFPTAPPSAPSNPFPVAPPAPAAAPGAPNATPDRVGYRWQPNGTQAPSPQAGPPPVVPPLVPPAPAGPPTVLLLPPTPEPGSSEPAKQENPKQLYPPQSKEPPAASFPVGISGFDRPRDGIASGQRPLLEGLDWLQKSNFKTVVFLHKPGEPTDADRQQVERRGMTFVPIEINPHALNRDSVERFLHLQKNLTEKLFVYDLDGSQAGAMWYVSFRLIDHDTDEVARIRAGSLGLSENRDAARDIWRAARSYVDSKGN